MRRVRLWGVVAASSPAFVVALAMVSPLWVLERFRRLAKWWFLSGKRLGGWWLDRVAVAKAGGVDEYRARVDAENAARMRSYERSQRKRAAKARRGL